MLLLERGKLRLDDLLREYLPEFQGEGTGSITLRHLLTHTSGCDRDYPRNPTGLAPRPLALACAERATNMPGTVFRYTISTSSCSAKCAAVSRRKLNDFVASELYGPLRMRDTGYLPSTNQIARIAPPSKAPKHVAGRVHDPTARRMGVWPVTRIFTTAGDLARYARMLLNGGELDGVRLFKPATWS